MSRGRVRCIEVISLSVCAALSSASPGQDAGFFDDDCAVLVQPGAQSEQSVALEVFLSCVDSPSQVLALEYLDPATSTWSRMSLREVTQPLEHHSGLVALTVIWDFSEDLAYGVWSDFPCRVVVLGDGQEVVSESRFLASVDNHSPLLDLLVTLSDSTRTVEFPSPQRQILSRSVLSCLAQPLVVTDAESITLTFERETPAGLVVPDVVLEKELTGDFGPENADFSAAPDAPTGYVLKTNDTDGMEVEAIGTVEIRRLEPLLLVDVSSVIAMQI